MKNIISLKNYREFKQVYDAKNVYANRLLVMYVRPNGSDEKRLGITVSKKVGNSIVRHRVTRLIRESYRLHKESFRTGCDVVFVAKNNAKDQGYRDIEKAMLHLMKLHGFTESK
ncbi:MAG: ribonuclease P protein component [Lachnospiraceae bacterium]|nr:ribonuclease P protein component [Lachnospiraceae bacterium]